MSIFLLSCTMNVGSCAIGSFVVQSAILLAVTALTMDAKEALTLLENWPGGDKYLASEFSSDLSEDLLDMTSSEEEEDLDLETDGGGGALSESESSGEFDISSEDYMDENGEDVHNLAGCGRENI